MSAASARRRRGPAIGLVSDTHGLFDPRLPALFAGCEAIIHAGDVVKPEILAALAEVAPVTAVRGNNDHGPAFARLPEVALLAVGELTAFVVHDLAAHDGKRQGHGHGHGHGGHGQTRATHAAVPHAPARPVLARNDPEIVVHGHSHRPGVRLAGGTLYVNPGSAGPRRFSLPRTAAVLSVKKRRVLVAFFDLGGDEVRPYGDPVEADL